MSPAYWFDVMFQRLQTPNKYGYLAKARSSGTPYPQRLLLTQNFLPEG